MRSRNQETNEMRLVDGSYFKSNNSLNYKGKIRNKCN